MDISLLLKIVGIGLLISVAHQVLSKSGREDQAQLVAVAGIIIVLLVIVGEFTSLIDKIRETFGL